MSQIRFDSIRWILLVRPFAQAIARSFVRLRSDHPANAAAGRRSAGFTPLCINQMDTDMERRSKASTRGDQKAAQAARRGGPTVTHEHTRCAMQGRAARMMMHRRRERRTEREEMTRKTIRPPCASMTHGAIKC